MLSTHTEGYLVRRTWTRARSWNTDLGRNRNTWNRGAGQRIIPTKMVIATVMKSKHLESLYSARHIYVCALKTLTHLLKIIL